MASFRGVFDFHGKYLETVTGIHLHTDLSSFYSSDEAIVGSARLAITIASKRQRGSAGYSRSLLAPVVAHVSSTLTRLYQLIGRSMVFHWRNKGGSARHSDRWGW